MSSRSWTSARHGSPAWVISAATRAPEDSAASSRPSRPGSGDAASAARCRSCSATGSSRSAGSSSGNSAGSAAVTGCSASQPGGVVAGEQRLVDERRPPQDGVAQPQVGAPLDPDAGVQQRRVPAGGVVPHPADRRGLPLPDEAGQLVGGEPGDRRRPPRRRRVRGPRPRPRRGAGGRPGSPAQSRRGPPTGSRLSGRARAAATGTATGRRVRASRAATGPTTPAAADRGGTTVPLRRGRRHPGTSSRPPCADAGPGARRTTAPRARAVPRDRRAGVLIGMMTDPNSAAGRRPGRRTKLTRRRARPATRRRRASPATRARISSLGRPARGVPAGRRSAARWEP